MYDRSLEAHWDSYYCDYYQPTADCRLRTRKRTTEHRRSFAPFCCSATDCSRCCCGYSLVSRAVSRTTSYFLYDPRFVARRTSRIETCVGEMRDPLGSSIDGRIRRLDRRSSTMSFGGCIGGDIEEIVYYCSRLKLKKGL